MGIFKILLRVINPLTNAQKIKPCFSDEKRSSNQPGKQEAFKAKHQINIYELAYILDYKKGTPQYKTHLHFGLPLSL